MKLQFDIEKFNTVKKVESEQYAIVEIYIVSAGNNRHNMPISLSTIKKASTTLKNKYLVAGFSGSDFEGHEPDEMIIGHFPESGKISYKKNDGKTYLVAEAVMSKVYASWAYEQFIKQNHKGVSMEITVTKINENKAGDSEIAEFVFNGVTILGDKHTPAIDGAKAEIVKFEVDSANKFYGKYSWGSKNNLNPIGVETGKEGTEDMEDEKDIIVEEVIDETPEVIEDVIEEPEAIEEEEVIEQSDEVEEEIDEEIEEEPAEDSVEEEIFEDEEEDNNEDEKEKETEEVEFESLTVEQKFTIFQAACRDAGYGFLESFDDEYIYCNDWDAGCTYRYSYTLDGTEVSLGVEKERVVRGGYVPFEEITEEGGEAAEPVVAEDVAIPDVEALQEEVAKLEEIIAEYEDEKKTVAVENILVDPEVSDALSSEQISELREEAKEFSLENLNEFSNKVKALAFESVKGKKGKYSFAKMAFGEPEAEKPAGKYSWK